jgi:hypothetical protein
LEGFGLGVNSIALIATGELDAAQTGEGMNTSTCLNPTTPKNSRATAIDPKWKTLVDIITSWLDVAEWGKPLVF